MDCMRVAIPGQHLSATPLDKQSSVASLRGLWLDAGRVGQKFLFL